MTKIVYASLTASRASRAKARSTKPVPSKIITAPDGSKVKISTVDADSPTFSQDLTIAFRRNVARARRENKRLIETAERLVRGS